MWKISRVKNRYFGQKRILWSKTENLVKIQIFVKKINVVKTDTFVEIENLVKI